MAGKKRTADKQSAAPMHRKLRHKRAETRITVTPLVRNGNLPRRPVSRAREKSKEPIESVDDEDAWWALPLPTSPAPSPPRPLDICTPSKCTVHVDPNDTQSYAYRPLYDENNKTLKDARGRPVAGRHRIPGAEVVRDRSYLHLSHKARVNHGIAHWPRPPFEFDDPDVRDHFIDEYHKKNDENMVDYTPPEKDPPIAVHTTAKKTMNRLPRRLFLDESGVVEERHCEENAITLEEEKEEETTLDKTDMNHSQRDMISVSSSTNRRSSKMSQEKGRKSAAGILSIGSAKSNSLKMTLPLEGMEEDEKNEEEKEEVSDESEGHTDDRLMDSMTLEKEKEKDATLEKTDINHSRRDKRSVSSSTKRRSSKMSQEKGRKSTGLIYIGSAKSNSLKMRLPMEGIEEGGMDQDNEGVTHESAVSTADNLMAGDHSVIVDVEKKAMEDQSHMIVKTARPHSRGDMGERSSSSRKRRASKEATGQGSKTSSRRLFDTSYKSNGVRRLEESMEDVEVMNEEMEVEMKKRLGDGEAGDAEGGLEGGQMDGNNEKVMDGSGQEEDEEEDEMDEEELEEDDGDEEEEEANDMRIESSGGEDSQEMEMDEDIEDETLEETAIAQLDKTLPISSVVSTIVHLPLRRLLAVCNQDRISKMDEFMSSIESGRKVGEGSYAEVFLVKRKYEEETRVFKIIRMEEEDSSRYIGEVIISKELTKLRGSSRGSTTSFAKMYSAKVLQGPFPPILAEAWDDFKITHDENEAMNDENPEEWGDAQLYICIECEFGGLNLKKFPFSTVLEVVSIFCQTAVALAVAEAEFQFEHRDLHEENVLVKRTGEETLEFVINGEDSSLPEAITVPTHGVRSTLIDFTLSRMTKGGETVNHEIADDVCDQEAEAEQYQVYKEMKKMTKGKWMKYTPKSNVLWLRMQLNWIIHENLGAKSEMNKARVKAWKEKKKQASKEAKRKSTGKSPTAQPEETEISGEAWLKKVKESSKVISALKNFVKTVDNYKSAHDLVQSKRFKTLLHLLE